MARPPQYRRQRSFLGALALGVLIVVARSSGAQQVSDYDGRFVFSGGQEERSSREAAIEASISGMNRFARPFARSGLKGATKVAEAIEISTKGDNEITITFGSFAPKTTTLDGRPAEFRIAVGRITVSRTFKNGEVVAVAGRGETKRKAVYRLSPDGKTLTVGITITASMLTRPLTYSLTYKRQ